MAWYKPEINSKIYLIIIGGQFCLLSHFHLNAASRGQIPPKTHKATEMFRSFILATLLPRTVYHPHEAQEMWLTSIYSNHLLICTCMVCTLMYTA